MTYVFQLGAVDISDDPYWLIDGTFDTTTPGRVAFALGVQASTMTAVSAAVEALQAEIDAAEVAAEDNALSWISLAAQFDAVSPVYYDVITGSVAVTAESHQDINLIGRWVICVVELTTTLYPRGAAVDGGTQSALVGAGATWLQPDVAGSLGAFLRLEIEDTSITGVINRIRFARRAAKSAVVGDYDPWVDVANAGSATDETDANAFGGSYAQLVTSSTSWVDLGRGVMPTGALNQGRLDLWARVKDTATVMSAPTSLNGVVDEPTSVAAISKRQQSTNNNGASATTVVDAFSSTTLAGSALLAAVSARVQTGTTVPNREQDIGNTGTGTSVSISGSNGWGTSESGALLVLCVHTLNDEINTPSGWTRIYNETTITNAYISVFIRPNAPATSSVSTTLQSSGFWSAHMTEYTGMPATNNVDQIKITKPTSTSLPAVSLSSQTASRYSVQLAVFVNDSGSTANGQISGWSNGFVETRDVGGLFVADNIIVDGPGIYGTDATGTSADWVCALISLRGSDTPPNDVVVTPPSGWSNAGYAVNYQDNAKPVAVWFFYRANAPATSGNLTFTFSETVNGEIWLAEYVNCAVENLLDLSGSRIITDATTATLASNGVSSQSGVRVIVACAAYNGGTTFSGVTGGFFEVSDAGGLAIMENTGGAVQPFSLTATMSQTDSFAGIMIGLKQDLLEENIGSLLVGTYHARVQAVDVTGNPTNATSSITDTVTNGNAAIAYSWSAPSGNVAYYYLSWEIGGVWRRIITTETNYTLTDPEDGQILSGEPATSGAVATPARLRALIGTIGTPTADMLPVPEVALGGENAWRLVKLASGRDLPPVGANFDATRPEWAVDLETYSPSGLSATVQVDALWLPSHSDAQATIEYPDLDLATKYRWVIESDRRGRGLIAWLENIATDAESGQLDPVGYIDLGPGDNVISLELEQAAGLVDLANARVNVAVTYWNIYRWQAGS